VVLRDQTGFRHGNPPQSVGQGLFDVEGVKVALLADLLPLPMKPAEQVETLRPQL
jgi:hypothetical protein